MRVCVADDLFEAEVDELDDGREESKEAEGGVVFVGIGLEPGPVTLSVVCHKAEVERSPQYGRISIHL
jgi:hypothetical protein